MTKSKVERFGIKNVKTYLIVLYSVFHKAGQTKVRRQYLHRIQSERQNNSLYSLPLRSYLCCIIEVNKADIKNSKSTFIPQLLHITGYNREKFTVRRADKIVGSILEDLLEVYTIDTLRQPSEYLVMIRELM